MSDITLRIVEDFFVQAARDGNVTPSMFRTWSDDLARVISRNSSRKFRENDSKRRPGKSESKSTKKAPTKAKAKVAEPKKEVIKAEKANDVLKKGALKKILGTLDVKIPDGLDEKPWKDIILPYLKSAEADPIYKKLEHYVQTPIADGSEISGEEDKGKLTKYNLERLFSLSKLDGKERKVTKSFVPVLAGREGVGSIIIRSDEEKAKRLLEKKARAKAKPADDGESDSGASPE